MDLRAFAPTDEGALLEVKDPGGELLKLDGKQVSIKLASHDSSKWKKSEQAAFNRRVKAAQSRQGRVSITAAEAESDRLANVVAVTLAWENAIVGGENLPCNPENAGAVYREFPFIFEQAEAFATTRENFMKGSAAA
jgi:hypothetical protein